MKGRHLKVLRHRYRAMLAKVDTFRDGLGLGVDRGVRKPVALFNLLGFKTIMSCEGHLAPGHGEVSPWIDISVKGSAGEERLRKLIRAYWQYNKKRNPNITGIWVVDNLPFRRGLKNVRIQAGLEHFNSIRKEKRKMPLSVRRWFLAEGTKEMKALTRYLWKRYTGEVKAVYNAPHGSRRGSPDH